MRLALLIGATKNGVLEGPEVRVIPGNWGLTVDGKSDKLILLANGKPISTTRFVFDEVTICQAVATNPINLSVRIDNA